MVQDEIELTRSEQALQTFFRCGRAGGVRECRRAAGSSPVLGLDGGQ
jgi:hypothetical protein